VPLHSAVADAMADAPARAVTRRVAGWRRAGLSGPASRSQRMRPALDAGQPPLTLHLAQVGAGPPASRPAAPDPRRPPRYHAAPATVAARRLVVAAGAALILVAAGYLLTRGAARPAVHRPPPGSPSAPSASGTPVSQAEDWLRANLAPTTPLCAGPQVVGWLRAAQFGDAQECPAGGWEAARFAVSTPDVRAVFARALAGRATLPVADFGAPPQRVEVRMIVSGGPAELALHLARDVRDQATAGAALLRNPRLRVDAGPRAVLARGSLDLRAATVLALLAAQADVHVTAIPVDAAEAAADRPARTVVADVPDRPALTTTLRMLHDGYPPARVDSLPGNGTRLIWAVGLAPAQGF
jgi:hypothetical protein